ncbi:tRNA (N6-isopentenyl adenosine(37)-C2)-methylthiotransferase MiaB [Lacrimispora saccharolytica]|uniref:tRNA (N6-isopentenyl adenosine(37)-C2)-methylthiotransferase MiaB n=1 Tax=Lacrimispora saccharolytica TaxID=84030 RepID=UPI00265CE87E|nr:tRNA (N6-isopentenyl adenosine(37)-C2)-methylthiotransferase MiaB [Lacrimispora saccharolytica]MCF2656177.1 tRNA (N6-isopentenyl adenosine(37)-C2)-methylthiotransferase MiaB [Lacrimispora saccharolytica]
MSNIEEQTRQMQYIDLVKEVVERENERLKRRLKCAVVTFGCQMNARDSEKLTGVLREAGYEIIDEETEADFVIYNTCTVRDNANQKVYGHLGLLKSRVKKNPNLRIALCGCMMQEASVIETIREKYKFVNLVFGTHNIFKFPELLYRMLTSDSQIIDIWEDTDQIVEDLPVDRKYSFKSGINIMFGCNNFCSYCIVPYVRGRERSREPKEIIREIEKLVNEGVIEVMLLGQNVNSYGKNLDNPMSFAELLKEIEKIDGLKRIRFMTSHPKDLSDDLIEVMAKSEKICKHIHLPLQSGSDRVLKEMNRRYTKEQYLSLVEKIKKAIPDVAVTTDIIVGFPGETAADVDDTIDVIRKVHYDNAFTFIYSKRTGTPAAARPDQCDEAEVKANFDRVLNAVKEEAMIRNGYLVGRVEEALVEEINAHDDTFVTGRLSNNSMVHFKGDASLIGKLVKVNILEAKGFYYMGEMI